MFLATYDELEHFLTVSNRRADMSTTLTFLQECVEEETEVLLAIDMQTRSRRSKRLIDENRAQAQKYYVEEIREMIKEPYDIRPSTIMNYRRKPNCWAIAEAIRERLKSERSPEETP